MTSKELKRFRKFLKLSQKEFAGALGLKRRMIQYYEKGERDGDSIEIPKTVELACYALSQGVESFAFHVDDDPTDDASGADAPVQAAPKKKPGKRKAKTRGDGDPAAPEEPVAAPTS